MKKAVLFLALISVFSVFVYSQNSTDLIIRDQIAEVVQPVELPAIDENASIIEAADSETPVIVNDPSIETETAALEVDDEVIVKKNFKMEKIHSRLKENLDSADFVDVVVQFDKKPTQTLRKELEKNGCHVKYSARRMNLVSAECPVNKLGDMSNSNDIKFIWEDEILYPTLDFSAAQIYADDAWALGYNGSGVNVSVLDTGINTSHPAFAGRVILEKDFTSDNNTIDVCGHGTAVASVAASVNNTYKGIAHGAGFFNAKTGLNSICGHSSTAVMNAIDWSIENGAQVISMSTGSYTPVGCDGSITANYINQTVIEDNIPIIIAVGNNGPTEGTVAIPGCAENAITVGMVNDGNEIVSTSSRGPAHYEDNRTWTKPDVVAPGSLIYTADVNGGTFAPRTGTSFATPHVSGVVALMFQANPYLGQADVKSILHNTSIDLGYDNNTQGHGLVNASAAVALALTLNLTPPIYPPVLVLSKTDTPDPVVEGQQITYSLIINNTGNGSAFNVTAIDSYPAGVIFHSSVPSPSSGNNVFSLGTVSNNTVATVNITVNVTVDVLQNGTVLNNSFVVDFAHANGTNYSLTASTTTTVETLPDYPGLLAYYASSAADKPKVRNITSSSSLMSQQELLSLGSGADAVWISMAESPVKSQNIIVALDDDNDTNVQIFDKLGANNLKELTTNSGGNAEKRMDVAYDSQGRAMIVYANNSALPAYEIWNGTAYVGGGTLSSSSCTSNATWIVLSQKPNASEIIAVYQDSSGRYCGQVWNGSEWGSVKLFGNDSGISTQKFDVVYEQSSGQALVMFETSVSGVLGYCAWNGSWCSNISTLSDRGSQNDWVKLDSQRGSDRIILGVFQDAESDLDVLEWDGSTFGVWKTIDSSVEGAGNRIMDVAYAGTSGKAMVVYDDHNVDVPSYAACANASACFAGTWSSATNTTNTSNNCGEAVDLDYIGLVPDPASNTVLLYAESQTSHFKCAQFFDGSSWGSWQSSLGSGSASLSAEDMAAVFDRT